MTHLELAALVQTLQVEKSKVNDLLGKNVRCPSLVPGTLYIMKEWTTKHHANYNNPYTVVEFIGSGREVNGKKVLFNSNPAIKDMKDGDYYFFRGADKSEIYEFGAYMCENCVCITSSAVRVTCYSIIGHESEGIQAPTTPRIKPAKREVRKVEADIDDDKVIVEEIDDDGMGCPDAWVCHPISMRPLRKANAA